MDWGWFKSFPETLKSQIKSMKITVNWEKARPAVMIAFLAGLPLLLIAGVIRWRLKWLKQYRAKLASEVGQLRNDSQLHTPKAILIDLIRALPVCLLILAVGLILLTMQLNISDLLWAFSKKLALFWLVFGLCWKVLEKMASRSDTSTCRRNSPATGVARLYVSASRCCRCTSGPLWPSFRRCI